MRVEAPPTTSLEELAVAVQAHEQERAHTVHAMPRSARLIAWVLIILGAYGAIEMLHSLVTNEFEMNASVPGLLVGIGLLRRSRLCRLLCASSSGLATIILGLTMILAAVWPDRPHVNWFGHRQQGLHSPLDFLIFFSITGAFLTCFGWCYHSLTKPATRAAFRQRRHYEFVPGVPCAGRMQ